MSIIKLHYSQASDIEKLLDKKHSKLFSPNGTVTSDANSNTLLLFDEEKKLTIIKKIIQEIDAPPSQIIIRAYIVSIDKHFSRTLGINFTTESDSTPVDNNGLAMDFPSFINHSGQINLALTKLGSNNLLELRLNALEQAGHAKIISSPELMTTNQKPAIIQSGEEIPYQEKTALGNTTVTFKKAVLKLKVVPTLMPNQKIRLKYYKSF